MVTQVNQDEQGQPGDGHYPHDDCGEACLVSIERDLGKDDTMLAEEQFDASHGDDPSNGSDAATLFSSLKAAGIPAHLARGDTGATLDQVKASGLNRVIINFFSNHAGNPEPGSGLGHFVLWYGMDPATGEDRCMQPVGGALVTYPRASLEAASQGINLCVVVNGQHRTSLRPLWTAPKSRRSAVRVRALVWIQQPHDRRLRAPPATSSRSSRTNAGGNDRWTTPKSTTSDSGHHLDA